MAESPLHIYVDGSCEENQNVTARTPAGWGFCVVDGDSGLGRGGGSVIAERSGPVVTDPSAGDFLGAEVGSNNTAELTAFAEALRWALTEGGDSKIIIKTDSKYAGNQATGAWKAKANRELVAHVQSLWEETSQLRELSWEHVKAHSGHRWNERADHLAIRAANDEVPVSLSFWKPGQR